MNDYSQAYIPNYRLYPNQQMFYKTLPVMSESEINNITVDFNGSPTYFHNQATNEIYIKQFDIRTGITNMQKYVKAEALNEIKQSEEVNKKDFEALNSRLDNLEDILTELKDLRSNKSAK